MTPLRSILRLIPQRFRRRGMYIAFTVPVRSVLDFAGLAALLPVLMLVLEPNGSLPLTTGADCFS